MIKYGKPSAGILSIKQDFYDSNAELLAERRKIAEIYAAGPARASCKNCESPLGESDFRAQGVGYAICSDCGHLNGLFEETDEFIAEVYGADYSVAYSAASREAYFNRVREIYLPKAEHLRDGLAEQGADPAELGVSDYGAGSGYFVAALKELGLTKIEGIEISPTQVELAEKMIGEKLLRNLAVEDTEKALGEIENGVVSMIGVLEHAQHPRRVLQALRDNDRVRFLYISVPLFSPTVFFEAVFPEVFNRHLGGAHTHLYCESSIDRLCSDFGLERTAEWWFGADIMDLYRSVLVELGGRTDASDNFKNKFRQWFVPLIDDLQLSIDRQKQSSEVHLLLKFNRG